MNVRNQISENKYKASIKNLFSFKAASVKVNILYKEELTL